MKSSTLLLLGSLALNGVLAALFIAGAAVDSPAPNAAERKPAPVAAAPAAAPAEMWNELQAPELGAQIERLRAEGFPPAIIRAIALARIRERFAARRKALEAAQAEQPFWIPNRDPKLLAEQRALAREERRALRELLGSDPENGTAASLRRSMPNLSAEKAEQIAAAQDRYSEQRAELMGSGRATLPDDNRKINALDQALRAELAAILTPQEMEDYDLRLSQTASQLRFSLGAFDPNEQEFRAIFQLQSAFDQQWGRMYALPGQEEMRARNEAQRVLGEQIKAALGAERYVDYQRATDFGFRRTAQLIARLDLPPQTAGAVYAIQQEIQQRATELRRERGPDFDAKFAALTAEAGTRLTEKLGPRGYEAYKEINPTWLQNTGRVAPAPGR